MKTIYMILSALIMSVIATFAIAGLVSVSKLVKPHTQPIEKLSMHNAPIKLAHKEGICHHNGKDAKANVVYPAR